MEQWNQSSLRKNITMETKTKKERLLAPMSPLKVLWAQS